MIAKASPLRRRVVGLAPFLAALLALPLLAPTCGPIADGKLQVFSKGTIVIPMDACYQGNAAIAPSGGCPQVAAGATCGTGRCDTGDVLKAYGLAYQLIKNKVTVYWAIRGSPPGATPAVTKASLTDVDVTVQYEGGPPVGVYNWTTGVVGAMPPNNNTSVVNYLGGPFLVDSSDYQTVVNLFNNGNAATNTPALKTLYPAVKVHVTNVAFQAYVPKVFAGGWTAGGAVAPKLALLNIGSDSSAHNDAKNSFPIIQGYLTNAGLNFSGAAGVATDTGHGAIYDALLMPDFQPGGSGDWTSSNLGKYGYTLLWVPHWWAPGSCANSSSSANCTASAYSAAEITNSLKAVGDFVHAGNDLMAECAGIGSFEGVFTNASTANASFGPGGATSHLQATSGLAIKTATLNTTTNPVAFTAFGSPLMQIGDFPFTPVSGAIDDYQPSAPRGSAFRPGPPPVQQLVSTEAGAWNYFTFQPTGSPGGNVAYIAGHDYSTGNAPATIAGQRLVLNTLFNLGAGCVDTLADCDTGELGQCARGKVRCVTGTPVCVRITGPTAEVCDGLDNDCNGAIDDLPPTPCYTDRVGCTFDAGSGHYTCLGVCASGQQSCTDGKPGACVGQIVPAGETCNGLDDDCNGQVDDGLVPPGGSAGCYSGPSGTDGKGLCKQGTWTCGAGGWSCQNEVLPATELCEPAGFDENCDGQIDENCSCLPGTRRPCYGADPATANVGACRSGEQTCDGAGRWGSCSGQVLPAKELCNGIDDDCNGLVDDGGACDECQAGQTRACYTGAAASRTQGTCRDGVESCGAGGKWSGACVGEITPGPERCDGKDNDCNGQVDDGATCPAGLVCLNGVCATGTWSPESSCFPGYEPLPGGTCAPSNCPARPCDAGQLCRAGACVDPCSGSAAPQCGTGSVCSGGACVGGGCYAAGCPTGEVCRFGVCGADACSGVTCPAGTFCRPNSATTGARHDCVQSCAFVTCQTGERCSADGFCVANPCATVSCGPSQLCRGGACVADPCVGVTCGNGQVCRVATQAGGDVALCGDDACAGIVCPAGQCVAGQCYASNNLSGDGPKGGGGGTPGETPSSSKSGCGCGGGEAGPTALLLALLGLPLARRRRRVPGGGAALLLGMALLAAAGGCGKKSSDTPAPPAPTDCETCGTSVCVDVKFDQAHCASCGHACGSDQMCVDAVCGPKAPVAPLVVAVADPQEPSGQVVAGTSPNLHITGQRFAAGAQVRVSGAVAPATLDATFVSAGELDVRVDLSAAFAGQLTVRVVNPAQVISNALDVAVVNPSPFITSLNPSSALAGSQPAVVVTGHGFTRAGIGRIGSTCVQKAGTLEQGCATTFVSDTELRCTLDLRALGPGPLEVLVQNDGKLRSSPATFAVSGHDPVVQSVSPGAARQGDRPRLLLAGDGFEPGSQVQFGQGGTWRDLVTTYVAVTRLQADLILTGDPPGAYQVRVTNGGGTKLSAPVDFAVGANAPTVAGLVTTPRSPRLGDASLALAFSGTSFTAACKVEVLRPGAAGFSEAGVATTFRSASALEATVDLAGSLAGTWSARVNCAGNCVPLPPSPPLECTATAAFPFQVLSNVPQLVSVAPASAPQGTSPTLTVVGLNFLPGVELVLTPSERGGTTTHLTPTSVTDTALTATANLAAVAAGSYALTAVNPPGGLATTSNGLSFAVTPGAPVLSGSSALACTGVGSQGNCTGTAACGAATCSAACAVQGPSSVRITLAGSFFGQGSTVHASSPAVADLDLASALGCGTPPCDRVRLLGAEAIELDVDPTAIPAGTYQLSVWNPGAAGVQKSAPLPLRISTASCP